MICFPAYLCAAAAARCANPAHTHRMHKPLLSCLSCRHSFPASFRIRTVEALKKQLPRSLLCSNTRFSPRSSPAASLAHFPQLGAQGERPRGAARAQPEGGRQRQRWCAAGLPLTPASPFPPPFPPPRPHPLLLSLSPCSRSVRKPSGMRRMRDDVVPFSLSRGIHRIHPPRLRLCRPAGDVPDGCFVVAGLMPQSLTSNMDEAQADWVRTRPRIVLRNCLSGRVVENAPFNLMKTVFAVCPRVRPRVRPRPPAVGPARDGSGLRRGLPSSRRGALCAALKQGPLRAPSRTRHG